MKKLVLLVAMVLALGTLGWADHHEKASWTGTVSDSMCGVKHAEASVDRKSVV